MTSLLATASQKDDAREAGFLIAQNVCKMAMSRYTHRCRYTTRTAGQYVHQNTDKQIRYSVKQLGWNAQEPQGKSQREG